MSEQLTIRLQQNCFQVPRYTQDLIRIVHKDRNRISNFNGMECHSQGTIIFDDCALPEHK